MSPLFSRGRRKQPVKVVRRAAVARFGEIPEPSESLASWGGRVLVARDSQIWPMGEGGPMLAVLQLNLTEAPYVPQVIEHVQMLTLFLGPFRLPNLAEPEAHFSVRAYRDLDLLGPLPEPIPARAGEGTAQRPTLRALPLSWKVVDEQPPEGSAEAEPEPEPEPEPAPPPPPPAYDDWDDSAFSFATGEATKYAEAERAAAEQAASAEPPAEPEAPVAVEEGLASEASADADAGAAPPPDGLIGDAGEDPELVDNNDGTKLGGYPALVTGEIDWGVPDVAFVLQLDGRNPLGLGLGRDGMLYVGYRPDDNSWHVAHQHR